MKPFISNSRNICVVLLFAFTVVGSDALAKAADKKEFTLVKQWETSLGLSVPESVLYHESENSLYISNINGKPTEKNGLGFISKLSVDGKMIKLKWATGLNAPKGAAIFGNCLYVSDIDRLVEIDLSTGNIAKTYRAENAVFLNDVVTDAKGNVYISDMSETNSVIYKLVNDKMTIWLKGKDIKNPNGLHMEKDRLMVGNSGDGKLKAIGLSTKAVQTIATVGRGIDGLRPNGKGGYFVSDWKGKTSLVKPTGSVSILKDTSDMKINSADLEYIISKNLLLIPTFFDNRIVAYRVEGIQQ